MGGPDLEVAARFTSAGGTQFRYAPAGPRACPDGPSLAGGGEVRLLLEKTGYSPTDAWDTVQAINLDGGGSAAVAMNSKLVNRPTAVLPRRP